MSFKNKKVASEAGRKAGIRRTEEALSKLRKKMKAGDYTITDAKRESKMRMNAFAMDISPEWLMKKSEQYKA